MIHPKDFTDQLINNGLGPVVEVPCSYLKDFLSYLEESKSLEVINPVNEAIAMGIASGYYLSTGQIPVVAIQNSGLMNTLNSLTSLNQIYSIPVFYIVTWRGEGGEGRDAPEHDITGEKMEEILKLFSIPFEIIDEQRYKEQITSLVKTASTTQKPVALIIRKNTFDKYSVLLKQQKYSLTRYKTIEIIKNSLNNCLFISSTGYPSRDSFTIKDSPDFYMVGSMGHSFALGLGVLENTNKKVVILDGDGAFLMQLGGLASFNPKKHKNIIYCILDNECYESTGGQQTASSLVDLSMLAKAFNFKNIYEVTEAEDLREILDKLKKAKDSAFIHIKVREDQRLVEGRVTDKYTCPQIKERFMNNFIK